MDSQHDFTTEFIINNLPPDQREHLLLKDTRVEISKLTGVDISIRGRYIKPKSDGTLGDNNVRPLYLHIVGRTKHSLTLATKKIQELLETPSEGSLNDRLEDDFDDSLEEKITCGIAIFPSHFGMKKKILGDNYENVDYIQKETNATITLRGKGSHYENDDKSDEPLYIYIKYGTPGTKKRTRQLVFNLIETVQKDFMERYSKFYSPPKKPEIIAIRNTRKPENVKPYTNIRQPYTDIRKPEIVKPYPDTRKVEGVKPYTDSRKPDVNPYTDSRKPDVVKPYTDIRQPYTDTRKSEVVKPHIDIRQPYTNTRKPEIEKPYTDSRKPEVVKSQTHIRQPCTDTRKPELVNGSPSKNVESMENKVKSDVDKITVGFSAPPEFNLKSKIYGPALKNVKHIEKVAGALILFVGKGCNSSERGDDDEPPHLLVKYQKPELKDTARGLISHLLSTVHDEYVAAYGKNPSQLCKPKIFPYNKDDEKKKEHRTRETRFSTESSSLSPKSLNLAKLPEVDFSRKERSPKETIVVPPPPPMISKLQPPVIPKPTGYEFMDNRLPISTTVSVKPVPPPRETVTQGRPLLKISIPTFEQSMPGPVISKVNSQSYPQTTGMYMSQMPDVPSNTSLLTLTPNMGNLQYVTKRSHTPEPSVDSSYPESKKMCIAPAPYSTSSNVGRVTNVQKSEEKIGMNRCLVPITITKDVQENGKIESPLATKSSKNNSDSSTPKNKARTNVHNFYDYMSDGEDTKSVICLDSDDEYYRPEKPTPVVSGGMLKQRSVAVQTVNEDEWLKKTRFECRCGKFTPKLIAVKNCAAQTDSYFNFRLGTF